jgi:hypothetical protein
LSISGFVATISSSNWLSPWCSRASVYAFAIEKRVGAHVFSLTFSNGASTTFRQIAHGGIPGGLYLGFNLTRKFF